MVSRITRSTRYVNSSKPLPKRSVTIKPQTQASSVTKDGVVTKTVSPSTQASSIPAQTRELTWWDQASLVGEGIVNQATDYQGIVNPSYGNRSILNKAIDRTIQGDFAGAGEIISQNPARFAGNIIFEAGTAIIPVGAIAKGVATGTKIARAGVKVSNKVPPSKNIPKPGGLRIKANQLIENKVNYLKADKYPRTWMNIPTTEIASYPFIQGGKKLRTYGPDGDRVLPEDVVIFKVADPRRVRDFFGMSDNMIRPRSRINYIPNPLNAYQKADVTYKSSTGNFKKASSVGNFKKVVKPPQRNTGRV